MFVIIVQPTGKGKGKDSDTGTGETDKVTLKRHGDKETGKDRHGDTGTRRHGDGGTG